MIKDCELCKAGKPCLAHRVMEAIENALNRTAIEEHAETGVEIDPHVMVEALCSVTDSFIRSYSAEDGTARAELRRCAAYFSERAAVGPKEQVH